jgi:uncharacterized protein
MHSIFLSSLAFFKKYPSAFWLVILAWAAISFSSLYRLDIDEDISSIMPSDSHLQAAQELLSHLPISEQLVIVVEPAGGSAQEQAAARQAADSICAFLSGSPLIESMKCGTGAHLFTEMREFFSRNSHLYLTAADYADIEKRISSPETLDSLAGSIFRSIMSPAGLATRKLMLSDPLGISFLAMKRLQEFETDTSYAISDGYIIAKKGGEVLMFAQPASPSSDTRAAAELMRVINEAAGKAERIFPGTNIFCYGGTAVAASNAGQIKKDITLTVGLAAVFLVAVFLGAFKSTKTILLLFFPIVFGAGLSLAAITFIYGSVSSISLSVAAVLICMSIDYSLHFYTHYRSTGSASGSLRAVSEPVIMSALTTVSAFACLFAMESEIMGQLGMLVSLTIICVAASVLMLSPYMLQSLAPGKAAASRGIFDKISELELHKSKPVVIAAAALSIAFIFAPMPGFDADLSKMSYLDKNLALSEAKLQAISSEALGGIIVAARGGTPDEAAEKLEQASPAIRRALGKGLVRSAAEPGILAPSGRAREIKARQWNSFWTTGRIDALEKELARAGNTYGFRPGAFQQFTAQLRIPREAGSTADYSLLGGILGNYHIKTGSGYAALSVLRAERSTRKDAIDYLSNETGLLVFDKTSLVTGYMGLLRADFNKLVVLSMCAIFGILLIFLGRIELALAAFAPIALSWLWTLGLMGFFGIEFNLFNIIISSFILGLGVDYSIFTLRGLQAGYIYGHRPMAPYRLSILMSVLTTAGGVCVLVFAKHPALNSIAWVTLFGLFSVVLMANTVLPLMFGQITKIVNGMPRPRTFVTAIAVSLITLFIFVAGSILLTLCIPVLYSLPLPRRQVKYLFHKCLSRTCWFIVRFNVLFKYRLINKHLLDFSKPSVIICNHQSHLDLMLVLMLHPKIIVATNKWVWNNLFFGHIVKFADFYPMYKGIDGSLDPIARKVAQGYSVLIFPEGSRTAEGNINRFHQGAFRLAADLGLPLQPVLLHGIFECMPKTDFFLRPGSITVKALERINIPMADYASGESYRSLAKATRALFAAKLQELDYQLKTVGYCYPQLIDRYLHKGPVLEWYMKTKLRLENNYQWLESQISKTATVTDVGCGYGFASVMLSLSSSGRRLVTGIDYDEHKIAVAANIASYTAGLDFVRADITCHRFQPSDVFIISDVLHYLPLEQQLQVLRSCARNLNPGGKIIVRDADADYVKRTRATRFTEFLSTKVFLFNKTSALGLQFVSGRHIEEFASLNNLKLIKTDLAKLTSNIYYVLQSE